MTDALKAVKDGTFVKNRHYSVAEWLEEWVSTYCTDLKPSTISGYKSKIKTRINPYIGDLQLASLSNVQIQKYCNALQKGDKQHKPLSSKSIQNIHGILHMALEQAVAAHVLQYNPSDHVKLPKVKKPDLKPLMDDDDVRRQLQKAHDSSGYIFLDETKNGKERIAAVAPSIVKVLRQQRAYQTECQLAAGGLWNNEHNLVFTDEIGSPLKHRTVYNHFKKAVASIGLPDTRFHDLRHSYAINALQSGDSPKSVQEQLGHYSSAFTMDTYAAVSNTMRKDTQDRMEQLIKQVSDL